MRRIALIAGAGRLPLILADEAKRRGEYVVGLAIEGITAQDFGSHTDKVYRGDITETKRALEILRQEEINCIVMTGKIPKALLFDRKVGRNADIASTFKNNIDNRDYTIMKAVAARLRNERIIFLDPTSYFKDLLPEKGLIARRSPTDDEWADITFGRKIAKRMADTDIGQTVVVKRKTVLVVEAIEGTDRAIRRAAALNGRGAVVVKMARRHQDMRFDAPGIGPETIDSLIAAEAKVLAVEAKKTIIVDRDTVIGKADAASISVLAI